MKIAILLIAACTCIQVATAQTRKCTGVDGRVTYSDFVCPSTTATERQVSTQNNTIDNSVWREQAQANRIETAGNQAVNEKAGLCRFSYLAIGDSLGQAIAAAAKKECLDNLRAKATGQPTSNEAYSRWKDHSSQKQASRSAAISNAVNAENARAIVNSNNNLSNTINNKTYECRPNYAGSSLNCR